MCEHYYGISFRVTHPSKDLSTVGPKLGIKPFRLWKVGDPRSTPKGDKLEGLYANSYICIRLQLEDLAIPYQINNFLVKFNNQTKYWNDLASSGGKFMLVIYWDSYKNFTEEFDWVLLGKLSELHISLEYEIIQTKIMGVGPT